MSNVWFITGVSSGIGRAIAAAALAQGDSVIGTLRQHAQFSDFEAIAPGRAHAVLLDVTNAEQIEHAAAVAIARYGRIDVLVNNAGYGMIGALEETAIDEARRLFDTNFFGLMQVTQAFLPQLRRQGSGHIINVSSTVGLTGTPGVPIYSASKFAIEGLSEALAIELAAFGIKVSVVEPGAVLSQFDTGVVETRRRMPEYAAISGISKEGLSQFYAATAAQAEPVAQAIIELAHMPEPPLRLLAGAESVEAARVKAQQFAGLVAGNERWSSRGPGWGSSK